MHAVFDLLGERSAPPSPERVDAVARVLDVAMRLAGGEIDYVTAVRSCTPQERYWASRDSTPDMAEWGALMNFLDRIILSKTNLFTRHGWFSRDEVLANGGHLIYDDDGFWVGITFDAPAKSEPKVTQERSRTWWKD